ncbi:MAG TPA: ATP synthase F0 subunit B, partial [Phycisphaerales bacterium]|nr:ATP synthase F0 subunit B [Phycisphaerales bacterium]
GGGGGGDAHTKPDVMAFDLLQFIMAIVVFGVAFFILSRTAWPKIVQGLEAREEKIRSEVFAAEEARKKANDSLQEYKRSLAEAKAEAQRLIEQTRAEQARLAADLKARAESELAELRDQARQSIESAKKAALAEVYAEAATLATAVAGKILKREFNASDQGRLIEESVQQFTREYARA